MADDTDLYLEPKRHFRWQWWLILGIAGLSLLAAGGLALALRARHSVHEPATQARPTMTLVPTFTPRPKATDISPAITLSTQPWTDDSGPVGLVEVVLSLPAGGQVSHEPPPGFRYWHGDLLQTRQGWGWNGAGPAEVRWYLLRESGTSLPASLQVTVNGQVLTATLQPGTPATTSASTE